MITRDQLTQRRYPILQRHPASGILVRTEGGAMGFIDRVKENIQDTAALAREGLDDFHTKRDLEHAYGALGRKAFELIEAGKLEAGELGPQLGEVRSLRAELEAQPPAATGP